jgi:hypothetical protein
MKIVSFADKWPVPSMSNPTANQLKTVFFNLIETGYLGGKRIKIKV